jgi:phospholipase/carboxylesterase
MNNYERTKYFGKMFPESTRAIIMAHGRGGTGYDIVNSLEGLLPISDFYTVAPNADNNTWYPYSFLAPRKQNEPYLSGSIALLKELFDDLINTGFKAPDIYLLGFSQGACLVLDFAAQYAQRYGGIYAFSGGLIGEEIDVSLYSGNFEGTPVFLGCSNTDSHIPLARVKDSTELLLDRGATVYEKIYPGMGHTINHDEIVRVSDLLVESQK